MFKLNQDETRSLLRQPESGMGYQVVDAVTTDHKTKRGVVYNAELLALDEDADSDRILMLSKSRTAVLTVARSSAGLFKSLSVVREQRTAVLSSRGVKAGGAKEAAESKTKEREVFIRFSAFENDRRVTAERALLPETYATTEDDAKNVKTGKDAVARYALANSDPASHRFTIKPQKDTAIQTGTVEPANGQPGGGIEVFFAAGTQKDTVTLPPTKLPDE